MNIFKAFDKIHQPLNNAYLWIFNAKKNQPIIPLQEKRKSWVQLREKKVKNYINFLKTHTTSTSQHRGPPRPSLVPQTKKKNVF